MGFDLELSFNDVWVVMPAFNEQETIALAISSVMTQCKQLIVVDDCSSDETAKIAYRSGAHVISHPINLGQGAALETGIQYALSKGAGYVVTFDADGQHNHADIEPMVAALKQSGYDVALGSRFLGNVINMSKQRRLLLILALLFTRISTGLKLTDVHNGFRVLSRNFCSKFSFTQNRMSHASEILTFIAKHKISYIEYPVTITYTQYSIKKGQKSSNAIRILLEIVYRKITS